jgi:hypothetical protein
VPEKLPKDRWAGEAITRARIAYETWAGLLNEEIRIEPEYYSGLVPGRYAGLFTNYAKEGAFLAAEQKPSTLQGSMRFAVEARYLLLSPRPSGR